jgi:hypothetical protein
VTRAILLAAALFAGACASPTFTIPGGRLDGALVAAPVDDWGFTRDAETIQLETRPDDPYSVNLWCAGKGPALWVAAGSESNTWAQNLVADPRARVRVGDNVYERSAVRVADPAEVELVMSLYEAKYDWEPDPDSPRVVFRLDPR